MSDLYTVRMILSKARQYASRRKGDWNMIPCWILLTIFMFTVFSFLSCFGITIVQIRDLCKDRTAESLDFSASNSFRKNAKQLLTAEDFVRAMAHSVTVQHTLSSCILPIAFSDSLAKHFLRRAHHMTQVRCSKKSSPGNSSTVVTTFVLGSSVTSWESRFTSVPLPAGHQQPMHGLRSQFRSEICGAGPRTVCEDDGWSLWRTGDSWWIYDFWLSGNMWANWNFMYHFFISCDERVVPLLQKHAT